MTSASTSHPVIGCVVLAAGSSQRFGSDKRHYRLAGGITLLDQTLTNLQPVFQQRVLVLRPGDGKLAASFEPFWDIVIAADASQGMGHSVAAAVSRFENWDGAVIALADMPWVATATIRAIVASLTAEALVVPHYQGQRGNPVGIGRRYFPELAQLSGDTGARGLFQRHADAVVKLEVADAGILQDLDTPPTS